jgi:hypothetical protein
MGETSQNDNITIEFENQFRVEISQGNVKVRIKDTDEMTGQKKAG